MTTSSKIFPEDYPSGGLILHGDDPDDEFMKIIKRKSHGLQIGIIDQPFNTFEQYLHEEAEYWGKNAYTRSKRKLKFSFLASPDFNAIAYASPNVKNAFDFIGINFGVAITLWDTFNRMLSCPNLFPNCGNPQEELDHPDLTIPYITDRTFFDIGEKKRKVILPKNPVRRNHANSLTYYALLFLFFHELSHLIRGHIELKKHFEKNKSFISEAFPETKSIIPKSIQLMLEWDADNEAVRMLFDGLIVNLKELKEEGQSDKENLELSKYAYQEIDAVIYTTIVSFYTIFRLQDCNVADYSILEKVIHPPAPIRQISVLQYLHAYAIKTHPECAHSFKKIAQKAIMTCESGFAKMIDNETPDVSGFLSAQEQKFPRKDYLENMIYEFNKHKGKLNKHRRFKKIIA